MVNSRTARRISTQYSFTNGTATTEYGVNYNILSAFNPFAGYWLMPRYDSNLAKWKVSMAYFDPNGTFHRVADDTYGVILVITDK